MRGKGRHGPGEAGAGGERTFWLRRKGAVSVGELLRSRSCLFPILLFLTAARPISFRAFSTRPSQRPHLQSPSTHRRHTMKAARYSTFGPASVISIDDVEKPAPKPGHAVVKVHAASLNPVDFKCVCVCVCVCDCVCGAAGWVGGANRPPPWAQGGRAGRFVFSFFPAPRALPSITLLPSRRPARGL